MMSILANYLKRVPGLVVPQPLFAAEQFLSMVRSMGRTCTLLATPPARKGKQFSRYAVK